MSTEGCVAQTAIDAREDRFKVTVIASAVALWISSSRKSRSPISIGWWASGS